MAAFRSGLETQRGVCGNSAIEQAWVQSAADRRRGRVCGEHSAATLDAGGCAEVGTQGEATQQASAAYLRERQTAQPNWIPASVLHREIAERGYEDGLSQLRAIMRSLRPTLPVEPEVRLDTAMGEQLQVDWVEFRKGSTPLHAFCATMGYSRASYVEFVSDMKVATLIGYHERASPRLAACRARSYTTI